MTTFILMNLIFLAATFATPASDDAEVRAVVKQFATAADKQDAAGVRSVLHKEAQQFFKGENGLVRLETAVYLGMIEQKKIGGQPRKLTIDHVAVDGDMASVKATMVNKAYRFDNFISLMKVEGQWQIMSIVLRMQAV
ncbi:MAG: nuclear transport factor 2 family protein [Bacteroidota bacterium]